MSELPDFKKISFSEMLAIPLEKVVTDASPEVSHHLWAEYTLTVCGSGGEPAAASLRMRHTVGPTTH